MDGYGLVDATESRGGNYTLDARVNSGAPEYQHLRDSETGTWARRDDVDVALNDISETSPLTVGLGQDSNSFGPELQFGHVVGAHIAQRVLLVKVAWGGKSLHGDFRPPTAAASRPEGGGTGAAYTDMVSIVMSRLTALGQRGVDYELRGFMWHQGCNQPVIQCPAHHDHSPMITLSHTLSMCEA